MPKIELFVARLRIAWHVHRGSAAAFARHFQEEQNRILALAQPLDAAAAGRRVLIKRLRGLEDSSRYWSVWMTLDHLRIVNQATTGVIRALLAGQALERKASTAAVKPSAEVNESAVSGFKESCAAFVEAVSSAPDLRTNMRFAHPWFGPLDANGWHALSGIHMGLHRHQIECILAQAR